MNRVILITTKINKYHCDWIQLTQKTQFISSPSVLLIPQCSSSLHHISFHPILSMNPKKSSVSQATLVPHHAYLALRLSPSHSILISREGFRSVDVSSVPLLYQIIVPSHSLIHLVFVADRVFGSIGSANTPLRLLLHRQKPSFSKWTQRSSSHSYPFKNSRLLRRSLFLLFAVEWRTHTYLLSGNVLLPVLSHTDTPPCCPLRIVYPLHFSVCL